MAEQLGALVAVRAAAVKAVAAVALVGILERADKVEVMRTD